MGIAVTTAGMTFGYAIEETKGVRPTTGYKIIPDVKEIPTTDSEPNVLENTPLSNTKSKTYTLGLQDPGGSLTLTANHTEDLETFWDELVSECETAKASGLATWFEIKHPTLTKSTFFTGEPAPFGLGGASVDSILDASVHIVITNEPERMAKSTD